MLFDYLIMFILGCRSLFLFVISKPSIDYKGLSGSAVAVAFQSVFRAEIHSNDVFLFFKNYF